LNVTYSRRSKTRNPFRYGQIVGPEAFCDRERERADLTRAMENGEHLFVFSEQRMGKTSLVQRVLDDLPADRFLKLYANLWPTDSAGSFARRLAQVFAEQLEDRVERRLRESGGTSHACGP
jgi:AAA+ ATPase superfamily predicted ATPase